MENLVVRIKQLEDAKDLPLPKYMTSLAAGVDLHAKVDEPITLKKGEIKLVPTGIAIALPAGYEAQIRPRSGLAYRNGISLVNTPGTIDADYRGEIKVIMINFGDEDFVINRGERIAQMVINKVEQVKWQLMTELDETKRNDGGFGSTNV